MLQVICAPGEFTGSMNKKIEINFPVEFRSFSGDTIIDCDGTDSFLIIKNAIGVSIDGLTIQNCTNNFGGAIQIEKSNVVLTNLVLKQNKASFGGALSIKESEVISLNSTYIDNECQVSGGAIYADEQSLLDLQSGNKFLGTNSRRGPNSSLRYRDDLTSSSSSEISVDSSINLETLGLHCKNSGAIRQKGNNACSIDFPVSSESNRIMFLSNSNMSTFDAAPETFSLLAAPPTCNCLTDASCSCSFTGLVHEKSLPVASKSAVVDISFPTFLDGLTTSIVEGKVIGYFRVPQTGSYDFKLEIENLKVSVLIDASTLLDVPYSTSRTISNDFIPLETGIVHTIEIKYYGLNLATGLNRFMEFKWKQPEQSSFSLMGEALFFSQKICGDGILNSNEPTTCIADRATDKRILKPGQTTCGQGFCSSKNPNECFEDCYFKITQTCPVRTVPKNHVSPGFYIEADTIGDLISNQFVWHAPGSEHFAFGFSIVDGEQASSALFYHDYCNKIASNILEDPYRGNVYQLPKELTGKVFPRCSYDTKSTFYSSSKDISSNLYTQSTQDISGSLGGGYGPVSGEANVAFSKEKSVETAQSMKTSQSSSLIMTEVQCLTSSFEMVEYNFHPNFLKELAACKNTHDYIEMIEKYGTHFYTKATMGGSLKQIISTNSISAESESSSDWKESGRRTFAGSVSAGRYGSLSGSYEDSIDSSITGEQQSNFESKSSRSRVITKGGKLGSFGPVENDDGYSSSNFESWARSLDVLPVPVDYRIKPIWSAFNSNWKIGTMDVVAEWKKAEEIYYARFQQPNPTGRKKQYTLILMFNQAGTANAKLFNFEMKWKEAKYDSNGNVIAGQQIDRTLLLPITHGKYHLTDNTYPATEGPLFKIKTLTTADGEQDCYYFPLNSISSPYHFDFTSELDPFDSVTSPTYTLDTLNAKITLISWERGLAMRLNNLGAETPANDYVMYAVERGLTKTHDTPLDGIEIYSDTTSVNTFTMTPKVADKIKWYYWNAFESTTPMSNTTLKIQAATDLTNSAVRLNWMLVIRGTNSYTDPKRKWIRPVDAYRTDPRKPIDSVSEFVSRTTLKYNNIGFAYYMQFGLTPLRFFNRNDFYFVIESDKFKQPNIENFGTKLTLK
eukprot:gene4349-5443_t